jgi:catechol 2,3-dioxygenase-like lactoylglutathione lyase family enzyme
MRSQFKASFAIVALFAIASPAAAADPVHARVTRFDNVHVRVSDPAKATEWYITHLGARGDTLPARVFFGDIVISIVRTTSPQPSVGSVIDHFAVSFPDVKAKIRELTAAGIKVTPSPHAGFADAAFIDDPWGARIELLQDPGAVGFHHVHLNVPDPQATMAWYVERVGGERGTLKGTAGLRYGNVWLLVDKSVTPTAPSAERAIMNVAFRVADVQKAIDELKTKGVQVVTPPTHIKDRNMWYAFVEGPSGIRTELLQR